MSRFPDSAPKVEELIAGQAWPIGSVFISVVPTNPGILLGIGTWVAFATGRVLVGIDPNDTDFDTAEETSGAKTVALAVTEMPIHTHVQNTHTHTQDPHNHTQTAHNHIQDPHSHVQQVNSAITGALSGYTPDTSTATPATSGYSTANTTATCQGATAVNQSATATNQNTTAVNQNAGGGVAHNNVQPSIVVYMWKRIS